MDRIPETAAGLGGRSEALHEGVHGGHVRTVAGSAGKGSSAACRPNRAGPTNAIRKFFDDNPDEELSIEDVKVKFRLETFHARKVIGRLRAAGELTILRKEGRICFYGRAA